MNLLRLALPFFAAFFLSACGPDPESHSPGSRSYDVERYDLDAEYDWQKNRLVASVRITLAPTLDGIAGLELDSAVDVKAVRIDGVGDVDFEAEPENHVWVSLDRIDAKTNSPIVVVIDYEAFPSDHLRPIGKRQGDPLTIRAVFTDSEPEGARFWMPSHDEPADRAMFAAGLRMANEETLISNGTLVTNQSKGSSRYMRYETTYPLPTYLMAFAVSEFDIEATQQGDVPVEVWYRKGLPGDHSTMAGELARMIGEMETLVGPYPFERYALVLLPGHMVGGMENAGISFQRETSSTAPGLSSDLRLAAHELAHQWFGDLVTVKSWDDVWIKEGMATLLEEELVRLHVDASGAGTLHGHAFYVADGEAIWDPEKLPHEKYDSGPYGRSAWFFTQIRNVVGEETFFGTLRNLLDEHRMGNMATEDVVQAFAPHFEPLGADKLWRAIEARALPHIYVSETDATVNLTDAEGALLAPVRYEWVALDGSRRRKTVLRGELNAFESANADELLVLDPDDVHPVWETFMVDNQLPSLFLSRIVPSTSGQLETFLTLPGVHQHLTLDVASGAELPLDSSTLSAFLSGLHSDAAQVVALERACEAALAMPSPAWTDAIRTAFATFPPPFGLSALSSYVACAEVLGGAEPWVDEWQTLSAGLPNGGISAERLYFLSRFDANHKDVWPTVLDHAGSLRARQLAAGRIPIRLENHDQFVQWARAIDASEILRSNLLFRLGSSTRNWKTEWENGDPAGFTAFESGLDAFAAVLKKDVTRPAHAYAMCTSRNLMRDWQTVGGTETLVLDQSRWNEFVANLQGAPLSERAARISKDPNLCGN